MADLRLIALRRNLAAAKASGNDKRVERIEARIDALTPKPKAAVAVVEPPKPRGRPRKTVAAPVETVETAAVTFDPLPESD